MATKTFCCYGRDRPVLEKHAPNQASCQKGHPIRFSDHVLVFERVVIVRGELDGIFATLRLPNNDRDARRLRHAVIWRKLSFGTQSVTGSHFVETHLSVIETCRQQNRNVFTFVTAAVQADFTRNPAPKLLSGV